MSDSKSVEEILASVPIEDHDHPLFNEESLKSLDEQLLAHDMRELLLKSKIEYPNGDVLVLKIYNKNKGWRRAWQTIRSMFMKGGRP